MREGSRVHGERFGFSEFANGAVTERRRAMRVQKRIPWLMSLGAVLADMALGTKQDQADVISDRPGSVVIWPKVIADGTRDTLIALTNTSNLQAFAHCEYIVGTGTCSLIFPGEPSARYCSLINGGGCPEIPGGPPN